jgi:septum formation topological specificity factor MinE
MSLAESLCTVTKRQFESVLGSEITDDRWEDVQNEIVGRMDNFLDELLDIIAQDVQSELDEIEMQEAEEEDE